MAPSEKGYDEPGRTDAPTLTSDSEEVGVAFLVDDARRSPTLPPPLDRTSAPDGASKSAPAKEPESGQPPASANDRDDLKIADWTRYVVGLASILIGVIGALVLTALALASAKDLLAWIAERPPHPHFPYILMAKAAIAGTAYTFCTLLVTTGQRLLRPLWWVREYDRERVEAKVRQQNQSITLAELIALSRGDRLPFRLGGSDDPDQ